MISVICFFSIVLSMINGGQAIPNVDHINLEDGRLAMGFFVIKNEYKYFKFEITKEWTGAVICTLPQRGDTDMYVSCVNKYPSKTSYEWKSESISRDSVEIKKEDPQSCKTFYIGILGFTNISTFSILAYSKQSTVDIHIGDELPGFIESGYDEFKFSHEKEDMNVTILLHLIETFPFDGDIFVGIGYQPDQMHYDYKSTMTFEDDSISFPAVKGKTYYIAVYAYHGPFNYILSVYEGNINQIRRGNQKK